MAELSLDDLAVFVRVVEKGGFASAARELRVPTSNVSRAVARLEAQSGVRLLHRTTRTVKPTTDGRELFVSVAPAVMKVRSAAVALEPATRKPKGRLRISAPNELCTTFLSSVLVDFAERYPQVTLDFALTNQHSHLVDEGFDVALRATSRLGDSSLIARKLGEISHALYASPAYLSKHGAPRSLEELERHQCVVFRASELTRTWTLHSATDARDVAVRGRIGGDDLGFVRAMVIAAAGIGILPQLNCAADVAAGRLVRVLPAFHARGATLYLMYPSMKQLPARVVAFCDFVAAAFAAANAQLRT
ncbi:MAG TPA: LysR family transcriptional regulator [Polyangiaceae bacterium]|nr:LysR family transcriptional regulator [Polyangiaceae bacterium]